MSSLTGYLAPEGLEESLKRELKGIISQHGRLFLAEGPVQSVHWVQNIWYDVKRISFTSISDAAKKLRAMHRLWAYYPHQFVRRGELISSQLPFFSPKPLLFPSPFPKTPLGSWTLLDENTLIAASSCSSFFAHGEVHFQETKIPPSRAYLKLWEIFTLLGKMPQKGEICLEAGASPGSWTWVLQQLGAEVIAVDRAELSPEIRDLPRVRFLKKDAFAIEPDDFEKVNWVFSDVICYPEKLLSWIEKWEKADVKMICTIKFQGTGDDSILKEFEKKGTLFHLFHNKHEITWVNLLLV